MPKQTDLGARLRRLRVKSGLTQKDVGHPRYSAAYVSMVEAGRRSPSPRALAHFATTLGIDADHLVTGRPPDIEALLELRLQEGRAALYKGLPLVAQEAFDQVEKEAAGYNLVRLQAKAVVGMGRLVERQGQLERALEHFERAEQLLASEPLPLRADAVAGRARCHRGLGDVRYAAHLLESFRFGLLEKGLPDPAALMRANSQLVGRYLELGLNDRAAEVAEEALSLASQVDDPEQVATMHVNVARELLRQGRVDDALTSLDRAEQIYDSLNWPVEVARARVARGIVSRQQGDLAQSAAELRQALVLLPTEGAARDRSRCLCELAETRLAEGDRNEAIAFLEEADSLLKEGDVAEQALVSHNLGRCWIPDDPLVAEKYLRRAIELFDRAEQPLQSAVIMRDLGDLLLSTGRLDDARDTYREGLTRL